MKPRANGRNIVVQQLPTMLDVTCCVRLHILLHVVGCCCVLLRKVWNRSNFSVNNSPHFFCSVIAEAKRNNVGSVCTALPTRTQQLPTLLAQQCWELLRPFARNLKPRANGRNIVGGCCVRLHVTKSLTGFKLCATTPNNTQQGVQTNATCNIQQSWELLANNVASVCTGLKRSSHS